MSYMAAMGGWGVLDYALNFAPRPFEWLQLGYASYLSSWALMNTGRPDTNYGFWFPGQGERRRGRLAVHVDAKPARAWMGSSFPGGVTEPRGPWHYDGEIDLGFGGALRMAATIVTNDPIFGWFAYGGALKAYMGRDFSPGSALAINPRDGVRRRFDAIIQDPSLPFKESLGRFKIELVRDGFDAKSDIILDKSLKSVAFSIENRTGGAHVTVVKLALPANSHMTLTVDGKPVELKRVDDPDYRARGSSRGGRRGGRDPEVGARVGPRATHRRDVPTPGHPAYHEARPNRSWRGMPLSAGIRLGPYEVQGAIGAGAMGEVYRARDTNLNRPVAIKLLSAAHAADEVALGHSSAKPGSHRRSTIPTS